MRWLLASLLVIIVLVGHGWVWSLLHMLLFFTLMCILEHSIYKAWRSWLKSWRVLRWILIPMLILHSLFTPGEMVWVGFPLPISQEGLVLALQLSVRLCEMFACALLLGKLLPLQVWLSVMARVNILHHFFTPYLRLMPSMLQRVPVLVRRTYRAWRLESQKVYSLPQHMTSLMITVKQESQKRAVCIWRLWDKPVGKITLKGHDMTCDLGYFFGAIVIYELFEFGVRYL